MDKNIMKSFFSSVSIIIFFFLIGCSEISLKSNKPSVQQISDEGLNFLIGSSGNGFVKIKRLSQDWDSFQTITWGTTIQRGDLIQPPSDGTVTILCADLTIKVINQEGGNPCQSVEVELRWQDVLIVNPMTSSPKTPYILSPRNTRILEDHPLLKWADSGGNSYTVSIITDGVSIWSITNIKGTEVRYPQDAPKLQPGIRYLLEIIDETSGTSSGHEGIKGLGFELLTPEEILLVREKQEIIISLPVETEAHHFAKAVFYAGQGLYNEAQTELVNILVLNEPQIWLWYGKILIAMKLNKEAQVAYLTAKDLAEEKNDIESQAQALVEIWNLTGDNDSLMEAIGFYQNLGDKKTIAELQKNR